MKTGGVAEVGKVELIGLDIANSISAVQTFVPVIRNSDITGFQSGMTVKATGILKDSTLKIEKSVMPEGMSVIWLADRSGATGLKKRIRTVQQMPYLIRIISDAS